MDYVATRASLWDVVHTMRSLTVEQLMRFFRESTEPEMIIKYIVKFAENGTFDCPEFVAAYNKMVTGVISADEFKDQIGNCEISYHVAKTANGVSKLTGRSFFSNSLLRNAFWVVAEVGNENIREIVPIRTAKKVRGIAVFYSQ